MPLNVIRPQQFTTVLSALTDPGTVYFVPSFQRPYAWAQKQTGDLLSDMDKATRVAGSHYLSALHLIGIDLRNDDSLVEFLDDRDNADLQTLQRLSKKDGLRTAADTPVNVYAVVDGQQRLTTLLLLAHIYYVHELTNNPHLLSGLELNLSDGSKVPRLIQNPAADHAFMTKLISWIRMPVSAPPRAESQSQKRMFENTRMMQDWAMRRVGALRFLRSEHFKTSVIELEADYGLTSFMALNDRGRPLTVLEKLKSLLLQFASDAKDVDLVRRLHVAFGQLYRVLDECQHSGLMSEANGDDGIVKLLSCYIRLANDGSAIWQSSDAAYQDYFRDILLNRTDDARSTVGRWCDDIKAMSDQLSRLNQYLLGALGRPERSLHFGEPSSLTDDYRSTLLSLKPQPHLIALLLKFRTFFQVEWHQRFAINTPAADLNAIDELLSNVRQRAQAANAPSALTDYLNSLSRLGRECKQHLSMLEVIEQLQMLDWNLDSRKYQTFAYRCNESLGLKAAGDFVKSWAAFRSSDDFIHRLLYEHNEPNLRYTLKEYERALCRNLHSHDIIGRPDKEEGEARRNATPFALEHLFAQGIDQEQSFTQVGGFSGFSIADRAEYDNKVLWRSGNFTWLSPSANTSLGNLLPNIKAAHYRQCQGHPPGSGQNVCSEIAITRKIGDEMRGLGTEYSCFRLYIEARCAELALFAIGRFC